MKVYIRTLWPNLYRRGALWNDDSQKEALRNYLNDLGFYVLHGVGDSLDVYAVEYVDPIDIFLMNKTLDKIEKIWYALATRRK